MNRHKWAFTTHSTALLTKNQAFLAQPDRARPSKLTPYIALLIGNNVALGLTYALAAESAGITYQTFNDWMKKGKNTKSGKYFQFRIKDWN